MCVDFYVLSMQTKQDVYLLPHIEDLFDYLFAENHFSKINLAMGYHWVRITPDHQHYSVFLTRYGLFEWTVMPFGLTNAPSAF